MNQSKLLTKEQSEAFKAIGYDVPTINYYKGKETESRSDEPMQDFNCPENEDRYMSRPTLNDAADWLRENKRIVCNVSIRFTGKYTYHISTFNTKECVWEKDVNPISFPDHYAALSAGVTEVLSRLNAEK